MRKIYLLLISCASFTAFAGVQDTINDVFGSINHAVESTLFFTVPVVQLPFLLLIMVFGGLFFTIRYGFVNLTLFTHAWKVVAGKYDDPSHKGEISHFQALTSALSATVGLGNIAGVAVAIKLGGPGAVFWLWVVAFFGMSMKFSSCTFAQLHREIDSNGKVIGGPMVYLKKAFAEKGWPWFGKFLGYFAAVATIFAAFGGGNMFQANQTYELLSQEFPLLADYPFVVGGVLATFTGIVILGGIQRIADVTSKLVPAMCLFYCISCLAIILSNFGEIGPMFSEIFRQAFSPEAAFGGTFIGVFIQGVQRASFSNEAGVGSAAIAHAAAKTDEPVREGTVAMLGPFIDTIVVCTMTALTILITKAHLDPTLANNGALITAKAFSSLGSWMPMLLTIATVIFAYSTMISYGYYGERATSFLFGEKNIKFFRIIYVAVIVIAPGLSLSNVITFSDLMLLSMALPNIVGMIFISKKVKTLLDSYRSRLKAGEMKIYR